MMFLYGVMSAAFIIGVGAGFALGFFAGHIDGKRVGKIRR